MTTNRNGLFDPKKRIKTNLIKVCKKKKKKKGEN